MSVILHGLHVLGRSCLSITILKVLHYLYVILDTLKLLLEETLLLPNRFNLKPITKKCIYLRISSVKHIHQIFITRLHSLCSLIHVSVKVCMTICNRGHYILIYSDLMRL